MKISALYCDYDGTLAAGDVRRDVSRIPQSTERELRKIAVLIPFAIITSKDFDFIFPRTTFAKAWACVCGLDIRLADGRTIRKRNQRSIYSIPVQISRLKGKGIFIESKRNSAGSLLGLSVDWREGKRLSDETIAGIRALSRKGLFVSYDRSYPFIDVFAGPPDKGKALRELKRLLGVQGPVMYVGDSPLDNNAFREADISLGVSHGQPLEELDCEFVVNYKELPKFLASLFHRGLDFAPDLPGVRRIEGDMDA